MVSEKVMNGLIDVTAKRRKERADNRTQQDIVNELLEKGLSKEGVDINSECISDQV